MARDFTTPDIIGEEGHTQFITQMNTTDNIMEENSYMAGINNDFVGRNKNMLSFFREHDTEKRSAFNKLRDYFQMRAKQNREYEIEAKRSKVLNDMVKWDRYRAVRDEYISRLV